MMCMETPGTLAARAFPDPQVRVFAVMGAEQENIQMVTGPPLARRARLVQHIQMTTLNVFCVLMEAFRAKEKLALHVQQTISQ